MRSATYRAAHDATSTVVPTRKPCSIDTCATRITSSTGAVPLRPSTKHRASAASASTPSSAVRRRGARNVGTSCSSNAAMKATSSVHASGALSLARMDSATAAQVTNAASVSGLSRARSAGMAACSAASAASRNGVAAESDFRHCASMTAGT